MQSKHYFRLLTFTVTLFVETVLPRSSIEQSLSINKARELTQVHAEHGLKTCPHFHLRTNFRMRLSLLPSN